MSEYIVRIRVLADLEKQVRDSEDLLRENDDLAQMMLDRAQEQDMEYKELQSFAKLDLTPS